MLVYINKTHGSYFIYINALILLWETGKIDITGMYKSRKILVPALLIAMHLLTRSIAHFSNASLI